MGEAIHDWDGWLNRLTEEETAREVADIRAHLIAEISRAMSHDDALQTADADPDPIDSPKAPST
jgi:hypothetical protein